MHDQRISIIPGVLLAAIAMLNALKKDDSGWQKQLRGERRGATVVSRMSEPW
ncbi:MAG: hypothetical protein ABSA26_05430 [Thermoguttaceae bacterium]